MSGFRCFSDTKIPHVDYVSLVEVNGVVIKSCVSRSVGTFFKGFSVSDMFINSFFKHLPVSPI